jgi:hypothetical protein
MAMAIIHPTYARYLLRGDGGELVSADGAFMVDVPPVLAIVPP